MDEREHEAFLIGIALKVGKLIVKPANLKCFRQQDRISWERDKLDLLLSSLPKDDITECMLPPQGPEYPIKEVLPAYYALLTILHDHYRVDDIKINNGIWSEDEERVYIILEEISWEYSKELVAGDRLRAYIELALDHVKADLPEKPANTGQEGEGCKDLNQIANSVHKYVQNEENKACFQKGLVAFRKATSKFNQSLKKAKEAAIADPKLRYDYNEFRDKDKEPPKPPKEGYKVEDHYVLDDYPKAFWRPPLPFNPDGYLQRFQCKLFGLSTREDKPRNKNQMLMCEFALIAAIRDEALNIPECDRLTDIEKDDWVQSLWADVSNEGVTMEDRITYADRMRNINTAFNNVLANLPNKKPAEIERETKKRNKGMLNQQVGKLLKSSPSGISAKEIAKTLNENYASVYKSTSESAVRKTENWKQRPKKKKSHREK